MVQALVMCRPSDPLLFIARYLKRGRHADVPKIMLVGAPAAPRSGPAGKRKFYTESTPTQSYKIYYRYTLRTAE